MSAPVVIVGTGLVSSVGLTAPAACAAIRAGVANPTESRFIDSTGEIIMAHQVPLERPWRGLTRLTRMAAMAIGECLSEVPREDWARIPLLLCVAERERPGRLDGVDDDLFARIQKELGTEFSQDSMVIPEGRVAAAIALSYARRIIGEKGAPFALIAASDTLLTAATLNVYERDRRLLTPENSNGFMPGESASALLIAPADSGAGTVCTGIGFGSEQARIDSDEPLRADGLASAHRAALIDARFDIGDLLFRVTDLSGEQYYFKEADLALSRLLRVRQEDPQLWHPAEYTGACGAAIGGICLALVHAAFTKDYAPGPAALLHFSEDAGPRASVVAQRRP